MRLVIQKVKESSVKVDNEIVGKIGKGFMVLVGVTHTDTNETAEKLCKKMCKLRIFEDENGKMNLSIKDVGGELLLISQFTLYANCSDGNRPSFTDAAKPDFANEIYEYFVKCAKDEVEKVETGKFREHMEVSILNDGPCTITLEA